VNADDVFHACSLSKLFVSTSILQLVEEGKVDLDKPVNAYLPGLPARWRPSPCVISLITLPAYRNISTRVRRGDADAKFSADLQTVFASLADAPMQFAPGGDTRYTQTNYLVLARAAGGPQRRSTPALRSQGSRCMRPRGPGKRNAPDTLRFGAPGYITYVYSIRA